MVPAPTAPAWSASIIPSPAMAVIKGARGTLESGTDWPVSIISTQDVSSGARTWATAGRRRATVVVKATFYLVKGAPMRLMQPAPILIGDQHFEGSLDRSVVAASDVAPYLPRAEVMFAGHAYAPTPSPYMAVRLAVVGSRPLVDKSLHVFGERMWLEADQATSPVPFTRIPIRYERSPRGYEENPVGMPHGPNLPVPNIIDPHDPNAAAGFGPIAPSWPSRARLLRGLDPAALDTSAPLIPDAFAWSYFHAAPADQRCSFFEGNEWVVLEGLNPDYPRIESQLPSARARARVYGADSTGYREIGLAADTMWIDGDHLICCVVWRGNFEVESDAALDSMQVFAGLEMPGRTIPWPGSAPAVHSEPAHSEPAHSEAVATVQREATPHPVESPRASSSPQPGADASSQGYASSAPAQATPAPVSPQLRAGATLASPALQEMARRAVDRATGRGPAVVIQEAAPPAEYDPVTAIKSDAGQAAQGAAAGWSPSHPSAAGSWGPTPPHVLALEESSASPSTASQQLAALMGEASSSPAAPSSADVLSTTMPQPPSELRHLINKALDVEEEGAPTRARMAAQFEDSPTFAPDVSDIARIVAQAEAQVDPTPPKKDLAVGQRPSPVQVRPMKTTIRGLGSAGSEPPPTARLEQTAVRSVMQGEESPTAQLQVPDVLLAMAFGGPASTGRVPSAPLDPSIANLDDEEETGRPTLTNMEAPVFSQHSPKLPQVDYGEMRVEVERRIREGESLAGLDLSDVDLSGFDLSGQKLAGSRLDRAVLKRCRMRGMDLTGASLEGADLSEAELDDAMLERTNLVSAKLTGASLRGAFLTDANLTTADLRRANLDQASGQRTMFCRARLDGASACGARLDGADLTEAQLDGANLAGAMLPELRAYEISAEETDFRKASLQNARFDGSVLGRARFDGVQAEDSMWDRAVLDGACLNGAKLTGASFTKASLRGARLIGADLAESRFNRAVLAGADLTGVDLSAVTLDGADLTGLVTGT
jgi:uncharacterized protein YjbI with pentapeptide repeats